MKTKPAPPPVLDLSGRVAVIDDAGAKPVWKVLDFVPAASTGNARRVLRKHKLAGGWLIDATGDKWWVDA